MTKKPEPRIKSRKIVDYNSMLFEVAGLLESARRTSVRATNAIMTERFGNGFSVDHLETIIVLAYLMPSMPVKSETLSRKFHASRFRGQFPLP